MIRFVICLLGLFAVVPLLANPEIHLARVPDQGIQPVLLADSVGQVHLIYFRRDDQGTNQRTGRLYHRRYMAVDQWSTETPISSPFGQNDAIGMAAAAIDENDRLHVVWLITGPTGFFYSRSTEHGFETPRRIVRTHLDGVEAGASIAVHGEQVTVAWHAGDLAQESKRQVYRLASVDGGNTFGNEVPISDIKLGVCGCCSLATSFVDQGRVVVYRSAVNDSGRHMQVLIDNGKLHTSTLDEWAVSTCPVSSVAMEAGWAVFETKGRLLRADVNRSPIAPGMVQDNTQSSSSRQKHPDVAVNERGEQLIVWGEADGYFSGGKLAIALFDATGETQSPVHFGPATIPDYSVAAVTTLGDGFLVVY